MPNFVLFSRATLLSFSFVSAITAGIVAFAPKSAHADGTCSDALKDRTPQQTIEQHIGFIQAGNLDAAMCDYADDATVILPNQVITGTTQIRQGLEGFFGLFCGAPPVLETLTPSGPFVLITFHLTAPPECQNQLSIPNGSDTYFVEKGKIRYQTVHDVIVPTN